MRNTLIALLLALTLGLPAYPQTLAIHQPATPASTTPTPGQATAGAIIPGSPLADLTGAAPATPAPDADDNAPAPFGTDGIGLSVTSAIGGEAAKTFGDFISAVRQSTRLQPVFDWLGSFSTDAPRRAHLAGILMALLIAVLPGVVVGAAIRLGLRRSQAGLAARAAPLPHEELPADDIEQGIADAEAGETERRPGRRLAISAWFRRLPYALVNLGLQLIPLFGFALTIQVLISADVLTSRQAHLAVIAMTNGYLAIRLAQEIARFLVAPEYPSLRLVRMPSERAAAIMRWMGLLLATAFIGYVLASVAEVLGLSHDGGLVILRLAGLILHIEVAIIIWNTRRIVGVWIGGRPGASGGWRRFRRWLGTIWYIPALFYVVALWIALAAGVHHAFGVLLRVILVVAVAAVVGRLAWFGSSALLERLFPDPATVTPRHPALFARARAYNPAIRVLVRLVIAVLVIVLTLQGWGVNAFGFLLTDRLSRSLLGAFISVLITIAVALVLWEVTNAYVNARIEHLSAKGKSRQASRLRTLLPMIKATIGVVLTLVAFYVCMTKIGVNAEPLFASFGVLSIAIAFGSQKLVQDIITGLFLLLEDAVQVGDVVSLAGMSGTVERLSIRTIRLRGGDGSINIIPFSAVTTVTNMTRDFGYAQISIQVAYEEDLPRVYEVLKDIASKMREEPAWGAMMRDDLQLFGLDQFGASALVITGQIRTGPGQHWSVRREFYARVKARFEAEHIEMPYTYLPPAPPRLEPPAEEGK